MMPAAQGLLRSGGPAGLLAVCMIALGFDSGGFFPVTVGVVTGALLIMLAVRISFLRRPLPRIGRPLMIASVSLATLLLWTLLSGQWSGAPARSLIEFDRTLLYGVALILFGLMSRSTENVRALMMGAALAILVICAAALATRLLPDIASFGAAQRGRQLRYPVSYVNSLGLLAALGVTWFFALASSEQVSAPVRAAAAGCVPLLGVTLLQTYSRGGIGVGLIGLLIFVLASRTRTTITTALAVIGPTALAMYIAYHADSLGSLDFTSTYAVAQGHHVAVWLIASCGAAASLRAALFSLDERLVIRPWPIRSVRVRGSLAAALVVVAAFLAVLHSSDLAREYRRFSQPAAVPVGSVRQRLTYVGSNNRVQAWRVALDDFRADPVQGSGAGTFVLSWNQRRPVAEPYNETHSLYFQMLGELGLVGVLAIVATLATILIFFARALREERELYGALLAGGMAWALSAGFDWQWQMPVTTLWLFALGGAALSTTPFRSPHAAPGSHHLRRAVLAIACIALAVAVPVRITVSEQHLTTSVAAIKRGDCRASMSAARKARDALASLPDPYALLGYCRPAADSRAALMLEEQAVARDPNHWGYHYALAQVRAAAGLDPRAEARAAVRLNPREPATNAAIHRFRGTDPRAWRLQAARTPVWVPSDM